MTTNALLERCTYIKSIRGRNAVRCVLMHPQTSSLTRSGTVGLVEGQGSTRSIILIFDTDFGKQSPPNCKSTYKFVRDSELICLAVLPFSPISELTELSVIKDEVQRCCISAASSSSRQKKGEANQLCATSLPSQALNLGTLNPVEQQQWSS